MGVDRLPPVRQGHRHQQHHQRQRDHLWT